MTIDHRRNSPNPEPMIAGTTVSPTTTVASLSSTDNSTGSGPVESKEDVFAQIKEKFMNEINKIPCKYTSSGPAMEASSKDMMAQGGCLSCFLFSYPAKSLCCLEFPSLLSCPVMSLPIKHCLWGKWQKSDIFSSTVFFKIGTGDMPSPS